MISDQIELSAVPEIHGRSAAGVSHMSTGQARPTTAIAVPPAASASGRRWTHSQATAMPGTTSSAAPIFVSNPSPTSTPDQTSHLAEPPSSARAAAHTAATEHRTSSASGLLWRETATVIGVSASAAPATAPATRPKRRATRS